MKKITLLRMSLLLTLFFGMTQEINAQIQKGNWMIGGSAQGGYSRDNSYISISPSAGKFVFPKTAFGSGVGLGHSWGKNNYTGKYSTTGLSISPFVRHYFFKAENQFNVFGEVSLTMGTQWGTFIESNTFHKTNFAGGLSYLILPNVALEFISTVSPNALSSYKSSNFSLNNSIGFQIFLGRRTD